MNKEYRRCEKCETNRPLGRFRPFSQKCRFCSNKNYWLSVLKNSFLEKWKQVNLGQSKAGNSFRRKKLNYPKKCSACGIIGKAIEAHHYAGYINHEFDVVFLCKSCHSKAHNGKISILKAKKYGLYPSFDE